MSKLAEVEIENGERKLGKVLLRSKRVDSRSRSLTKHQRQFGVKITTGNLRFGPDIAR